MLSDLRGAVRHIAQHPLSSVAMALVLAIGLGFSTAIFVLVTSFTSARPSGVTGDADAVRIRGIDRSRGPAQSIGREFSLDEIRAYQGESAVFRAVAGWSSVDVTLAGDDVSAQLHSGAATFVTPEYFAVLGVTFQVGGDLTSPAGDGLPVIISDAVWERIYQRRPDVIGRTVRINAASGTIAGVAPSRFVGARAGGSPLRIWADLDARPLVQPVTRPERDAAVFGLVARLQPGVSRESASTAAATIAARFSPRVPPGAPQRLTTDVVPILAANYFPPSGEQTSGVGAWIALSMPLLVLLITCTSVSALLAGRALARRREMAVRLAMGASRVRLVRQLLTETAVLAVCAGGLALILLGWVFQLVGWAVEGLPLVMDWRSGAFVATLGLLASVVFGLSPALHATRMSVSDVLKEADPSPRRTRLQATLVIAQIALTQPALLAMGAMLLDLRGTWHDQARAQVADADRVLEVAFNTNPRYGVFDDARESALARLQARLAATDGIVAVAPRLVVDDWTVIDDAGDHAVPVSPGPTARFVAEGWPIVVGRVFGDDEREARGLAVVNAAFAERFWGTRQVVGRTFTADGADRARANGAFTVIGVVEGTREPAWFVPALDGPIGSLLIRTAGEADHFVASVRAVAHAEAPEVPVVSTRTRASLAADARRSTWRAVLAAGLTGTLALVLSAIGLYAVVAVAVSERRREIGIRSVLGADPRTTTRLFMRRGLVVAVIGLVAGLAGSALVIQVMSQAAILGVSAADGAERPGLGTLSVLVSVFVVAVAVVAAWLPARRAASIDPLQVLRSE